MRRGLRIIYPSKRSPFGARLWRVVRMCHASRPPRNRVRSADPSISFLARTVDAGRWAAAHAVETQAYVGRETHSNSDWVRYAYGDKVHEHLQTNLDDASIHGLRSFKDFLLKWGFIPQDFDSDAWIAHAPLEQSRRYAQL